MTEENSFEAWLNEQWPVSHVSSSILANNTMARLGAKDAWAKAQNEMKARLVMALNREMALKQQADKLAEALNWAIGIIEGVTKHKADFARKTLKEYRGFDE